MARSLPDSYRKLGQYAQRFPRDAVIYEQGSVPAHCFLVLKGLVEFEVVGEDGEPEKVGSAGPAEPLGHVAFFTGRPTSALARCAEDSVLLAVSRADLPHAVSQAPELAITLIEAFAGVGVPVDEPADSTSAALEAHEAGEIVGTADSPDSADSAGTADESDVVPVAEDYDEAMFFVDSVCCPVSGTDFDYLRVRTRAVRPTRRDTDFHVTYRELNPTYYAIVVCPRCGYAASQDEFEQIGQDERLELWARRGARVERLAGRALNGTRTAEDALVALELAMNCYELRRPNERRRAVLLHRRAWIERERGGRSEADYLRQARDAYQAAYERDTDISDEAAMRAAYLIGDLTLRLGDAMGGARWLETATRYPQAKTQTGLARMARERLTDARKLLADQGRGREQLAS
jgi:uncharacterized protein